MQIKEDFSFYAYLIKSDRRDYRLHWVKENHRGGVWGMEKQPTKEIDDGTSQTMA